MQVQGSQHSRKRSQTLPDAAALPGNPLLAAGLPARYPLPPERSFNPGAPANSNLRPMDGFLGGHSLVAATAAQAAVFPRSPQYSPATSASERAPPVPEKDAKVAKEKTKKKFFKKPNSIGTHKDRAELDRRFPALPSPGKISLYSTSNLKLASNASTTSLVDPGMSSATSLYSTANASTSTLVPADRAAERDYEKNKHSHFLSRQKHKLWRQDDSHLPLSSASSISKPTDPNAPQPLYSFSQSSPHNPSAFAKSVSGLDLWHGGRALRDKKKEDKQGSNLSSTILLDAPSRERENSFSAPEWPNPGAFGSPGSTANASTTVLPTDLSFISFTPAEVANLGAQFGVPGITPDDAWPLLKARLLHIFEGEDPRPPIESFNALVSVHLRRCIQRRAPNVAIEDLSELLHTGFGSLGQTLNAVPDERLVRHLVAMWSLVFNTILPFMQAVFLPLDLEFKGRGPIMTAREAADFWGAALPDTDLGADVNALNVPVLGEDLDVRRMVLQTFRDTIFLPRYDALMAIFSRLSLESIDAGVTSQRDESPLPMPPPIPNTRPGTASSNDIALSSLTSPASFPSSGSTLLDSSSGASPYTLLGSANRSRATSNTSAGSWHSGPTYGAAQPGHLTPLQSANPSTTTLAHSNSASTTPQTAFPNGSTLPNGSSFPNHSAFNSYVQAQTILDTGARLTEIVGRMLQCVSVLASVQSGDDKQAMMERLTKTLKLNWLGRGRTGRQRQGFIGTRIEPGAANSGDRPREVQVR
jgi:hypothetical protein